MNLTEEDFKSDFYLKFYEDYKNDINRLIKNRQFVEAKARNTNLTHDEIEFIEYYIYNEATKFFTDETITLRELYQKIGKEFGNILDILFECQSQGEIRSCIRIVCRRISEFLDGTSVDILIGSYDKEVQLIGTFSKWQQAQIRKGFEILYSSESLYVPIDLIELIIEFTV